MSDELPDRAQCLTCWHALQPRLPGGRYTHSGKYRATCECTLCEGKLHTEFAFKRNLSQREIRAALQDRTAAEPAATVMDSSSVPSSPAPASPQESVATASTETTVAGVVEAVAADEAVPREPDPPGTKRISNSEIQTFKRCRRKWMLGYWRRLELIQPEYAGPRAHGTKMHAVLANYYGPGPDCLNQTAALELLNTLYREDVEKISQTVTYENEDQVREVVTNLQKELELSVIMLTGFFEWVEETGADADLEIISAEEAVEYPLEGFDVPVILMGKLDIRARRARDGATLFLDWKNVGSIADAVKQLPMSEQALMYQLLETLVAPEGQHVSGGLFSFIRKVKRTASARAPFYARVESPRNQTQLRNFWSRLHGEIRDILKLQAELDAGADHQMVAYPTPDRSCFWSCSFAEICTTGMMDDGSRVEDYVAANYKVGDPYARYEEQVDDATA